MIKGVRKFMGTVALSTIVVASTAVPVLAASNVHNFSYEYTGQQGSVNGLKNGKTYYLDKGKVQLKVTSCKNVTSTNPSNVSLYRYRSTNEDVYYGTIAVYTKGTTTFENKAGKACSDYYITASGGVSGKQVKVSGAIQNK